MKYKKFVGPEKWDNNCKNLKLMQICNKVIIIINYKENMHKLKLEK